MEHICDYGCGTPAKFYFDKAKKYCCSPHYRSCPHQAKKIGQKRLGKKHSDETKRLIGDKSKERIHRDGGSPFKGKHHTEETKRIMSEKAKGRPGWSKGLTKETNDSIRRVAEHMKSHPERHSHPGEKNGMYGKTHTDQVRQVSRDRNILNESWKGKNNYWYGKNRSGENSPNYLPEKERTLWQAYKKLTRSLTEKEYEQHKSTINPNNYTRGIHEYHLDHIVPIWYGFVHDIPVELLSRRENLRMLWCKDNHRRSKSIIDEYAECVLRLLLEYNEQSNKI
jgi:hypothetical protein